MSSLGLHKCCEERHAAQGRRGERREERRGGRQGERREKFASF